MAPDPASLPPNSRDSDKVELRRQARLVRNAISPEERASGAERVAVLGLPSFVGEPGILGAYYPTPREFDPLPLIARFAQEGWTVTLPVITGDAPLQFRRWHSGEPLVRGPRGIMEPAAGDILRPALLLVPLLAFDARGARLGYGGGHYDRTLEALRGDGAPVIAIGLAFDAQEMPQLPVDHYDQRLDGILTPSGARPFDNKQQG
jgi:5-formyltetrahydrofolate cyclo-ligase